MKKIASFTVNHDVLKKGMYISRIDGDCVTYDIRMKLPNNPENDYLSTGGAHTIEHLFATYARNSKYSENIIYVGPMGCRTGFYFIIRRPMTDSEAIELVKKSMKFIADFQGEIPGAKKSECGNYKDHSLSDAKAVALDMINVLKDYTTEKLIYPTK